MIKNEKKKKEEEVRNLIVMEYSLGSKKFHKTVSNQGNNVN